MNKFSKVLWVVILVLLGLTKVRAQGTSDLIRLDPALDDIVPAGAHVEKLAQFEFTEGPVWVRKGGYLLFSDIPGNAIYKWSPGGDVSVFLKPSGYTGADPTTAGKATYNGRAWVRLIGPVGITLDPQGRVVFCAGGDREVVRIEKDGRRTVLASRYEGKRLNSPNDLVYKSDGSLYFTDPATSLTGENNSPLKELSFDGVYLLKHGTLRLATKDLPHPNGLAFSPDERYLYINDTSKKIIMRYDVEPDDTIANGQVFIDMSSDKASGAPDGMKVDRNGNVYCTGPGGLWIMSPEGKHLGTIKSAPVVIDKLTNLAFGDADGKTLYLTARTGELCRIRLKVEGIRP